MKGGNGGLKLVIEYQMAILGLPRTPRDFKALQADMSWLRKQGITPDASLGFSKRVYRFPIAPEF